MAYLAWVATGKLDMVRGLPIDALVMNVDDIACAGFVDRILANQTIGRNSFCVPPQVIEAIIDGAQRFCEMLQENNIDCYFAGGETATVNDIVRTIDVGSSVTSRMRRDQVIDASEISPHNVIVGVSSTGKAKWESRKNSGIGSNGFTNARHDALDKVYRSMRETYDPRTPKVYSGHYQLRDTLPGDLDFTMAEALLSPTRTYLPLVKLVLGRIKKYYIKGIIHCSGGGQTKIMKFGKPGIRYVKDQPLEVPSLFKVLQEVSKITWREMYQVYNMGWRLEFVVLDKEVADDIIAICASCGIHAQIVGYVESKTSPGTDNEVRIITPYGELNYPDKMQ